ncbi:rCG24528, isoform CRA_a [Rattus norvegicus]|uniref:RCG24528, isoform CRA_a n=1 Tax=Rattus norvegicus TaxID=10116 RepID=A6JBN0_RAT|nr:rCG24528, isoform CRA_a [Rattus norvegicus]
MRYLGRGLLCSPHVPLAAFPLLDNCFSRLILIRNSSGSECSSHSPALQF